MRHRLRFHRVPLLTLLLTLALVAVACTSGEDPPEEDGPAATGEAGATAADPDDPEPADAPDTAAPGAMAIPVVEGVTIDVDDELLQAAQRWIAEESGLSAMLQEEIFLSSSRQTRDVVHLTYVQQHDAVSVRGAQFTVHVRENGEVIGASQSLTETLPGEITTNELTLAEAVDVAEKAVPGEASGSEGGPIWLEVGTELRLGYEVFVSTVNPIGAFSVVVDGTTGEVLTTDVLGADEHAGLHGSHPAREVATREVAQGGSACNAPAPPSACIFVVDPIYSSGDPNIDPAAANSQLVGVPLSNLTNPGDGNLVGRYAQIAPQIASQYTDPDNIFGQAGRGGSDITFEAAMTYYWVDYTQGVLQSLGFDFHADDPVDLVPIEPEFPDNAFYTFVEDRIHMGVGGDGVNEAEDAQGIIHEYGHALVQAAIPNITSPEGGAFHEGFADLVSVFTTLEFRNGDIGCLFHWAERGRCIRRIDTDKVSPQDLTFEVHRDGEIYTGAVWDVFEQVLARDTGLTPDQCQDPQANPCDAVRDEVYATALGSMPFLTPQLTLADAATAFAASDMTFFGGRNADIIASAFADHGLNAGGSPAVMIEGLDDFVRSESQLTLKVVHSYRGDLDIRLDVLDAGGQQLCASQLLSPDPADDGDNVTGRFQLVGSQCESFLPPGPDQIWVVRVADTLAEDQGSLFQFVVIHDGARFVAPGLPQPIPDADPRGILGVIGNDPGAAPMVDPQQPVPAADAAALQAGVQVTHTYVGDLQIQIGVLSADGTVLCRVDVLEPDPSDGSADFDRGDIDASQCASFYPPTPAQPWAVRVVDTAGLDTGTIDRFGLTGPGGEVLLAEGPVDIPDNDPAGAVLRLEG